MPSGILGRANLAATTNTTLYTVPATKVAAIGVNLCNRNATAVTARLAIATSGTPTTSDWIYYDVTIQGNSSLERTGLVVEAGENVVVYASATGVSAMTYGYEE